MVSEDQRRNALVVFAREPKDGKVKTRLAESLPEKTVTALYKCFVEDILAVALAAECRSRYLYYAGGLPADAFLRRFESRFKFKRQTGEDLGARMHNAFIRCFAEGHDKVVVIGTDCLTLNADGIRNAFSGLDRNDVVLGPARDGGYYLIGLKRPLKYIFTGIRWGTAEVLPATKQRIARRGRSLYLLEEKRDIDTPEDLRAFRKACRRKGKGLKSAAFVMAIPRHLYYT